LKAHHFFLRFRIQQCYDRCRVSPFFSGSVLGITIAFTTGGGGVVGLVGFMAGAGFIGVGFGVTAFGGGVFCATTGGGVSLFSIVGLKEGVFTAVNPFSM
jgi:hypothetical protein